MKKLISLILVLLLFSGCNTSTVDEIRDLIDDPERETIDTSRLGINAFVNDSRFGSISDQFREVRDTLGLKYVRILFRWEDNVQSGPNAAQNFSFYDDIVAGLPEGVEALVVLTGIPQWLYDPNNWSEGNPRLTFAEKWVRPVVQRYGGNGRIIGFQIWNEPNQVENDTDLLDIVDQPANYVEMLARSFSIMRDIAPSKLVVSAATTSINQNYPQTLDYNRGMRDAGAQNFADRWAIHYYGKQFENVVQSGGVQDFLNSLPIPLWATESGAAGVNEQLAYGEQVWPFLFEKLNGLERIYIYQFTEASAPADTFGLRNLSADAPVSDLYVHLRDRD